MDKILPKSEFRFYLDGMTLTKLMKTLALYGIGYYYNGITCVFGGGIKICIYFYGFLKLFVCEKYQRVYIYYICSS